MCYQIVFIPVIAIIFVVVSSLYINNSTQKEVYGSMLSDEAINNFMKFRNKFELNPMSKNMLVVEGRPFYLAPTDGIFCKWIISSYGRIPKKSPYSRELDAILKKLQKERKNKYLKECIGTCV